VRKGGGNVPASSKGMNLFFLPAKNWAPGRRGGKKRGTSKEKGGRGGSHFCLLPFFFGFPLQGGGRKGGRTSTGEGERRRFFSLPGVSGREGGKGPKKRGGGGGGRGR